MGDGGMSRLIGAESQRRADEDGDSSEKAIEKSSKRWDDMEKKEGSKGKKVHEKMEEMLDKIYEKERKGRKRQ